MRYLSHAVVLLTENQSVGFVNPNEAVPYAPATFASERFAAFVTEPPPSYICDDVPVLPTAATRPLDPPSMARSRETDVGSDAVVPGRRD